MTSDQWKEWNAQGFIPGPDETEEAFAERIAFCQNIKQHLMQKVGNHFPFDIDDQTSQQLLQEAFPLTQELYGISPQWLPVFFSNHQLAPWHGGCAWIFQLDAKSPIAAFLQLRASFRNSPTYFGLYHRNELMAHEISHVGRMLYQESRFEEMLAYQSSSSRWRRWLGPIVQSSRESLFFILTLGFVILADLALFSVNPHGIAAWVAQGIEWIPMLLIALALGRLMRYHRLFKRCFQNLEALYHEPQVARHLLYRLRDHEIQQFAYLSPAAIDDFMKSAQQQSFRWRYLMAIYSPKIQNI